MANVIQFTNEKQWMGYPSEFALLTAVREAESNYLLIELRNANLDNMFGGESEMWIEENGGRYPKAGRYLVVHTCPIENNQPRYFHIKKDDLDA